MDVVESQVVEFTKALQAHAATYQVALTDGTIQGLGEYYALLTAWNTHLHLVAFASAQEFATRHVLESLLLLKYLPQGARIADLGSGGGLPIIPCLIARADVRVVLIEASKKKAVFLREVLRETDTKARATVIAERFEELTTPAVDFVTCRALERFESMLQRLLIWVPTPCTLLLFGGEGLGTVIDDSGLSSDRILIPKSARRFLFIVSKTSN
ncbi:MAG: RsmG family class I SAM-dependent methyltransferase [bacterium]